MNTQQINFSRQLIKGRIAEIVFEQMLRDAGCFTVLSFGYENILPELMRRQHDMQAEETMEIIRRAPDFAVINNESHEVHLIEVKYRKSIQPGGVLQAAERMYASWKPSYLFIATPEGFFFGKVADIVESKGEIAPLNHPKIPADLQEQYLGILNDFLRNGDC